MMYLECPNVTKSALYPKFYMCDVFDFFIVFQIFLLSPVHDPCRHVGKKSLSTKLSTEGLSTTALDSTNIQNFSLIANFAKS